MRFKEERGESRGDVDVGEAGADGGLADGFNSTIESTGGSSFSTFPSITSAAERFELPEHSDSAVLTPAGCCSPRRGDIDIWIGGYPWGVDDDICIVYCCYLDCYGIESPPQVDLSRELLLSFAINFKRVYVLCFL